MEIYLYEGLVMKRSAKKIDIYSELCPTSSATIIGAGLISITMGAATAGAACVVAGILVGAIGPLAKSIKEHKTTKK